jgi:hypothetical protein
VKIKAVGEVLKKDGLAAPELAALQADRSNYKLCLLQPKADLSYDATGLRHTHAGPAALEFAAFLDEAIAHDADLAVTPEYSMPWDVLLDALNNDKAPKPGKLWALGCESIPFAKLEALRADPEAPAHFVFEDLAGAQGAFVDPLAYVFWAPKKNSKTLELVVLVQFKTEPMSDAQHFEVNHLRRGTLVYQFGEHGKSVRLTSFICSDVLKVDDAIAAEVYDRGLILHIQLNPEPRHKVFRAYRDKLMRLTGDATEIICLNWASGVAMSAGGTASIWNTPSNSAWYLRPSQFDRNDAPLAANHRKGLYYTYEDGHRLHALFFNYEPGLFVVEATKAAHIAEVAIAKRTGPNLKEMLTWNGAAWVQSPPANDGFRAVVAYAGAAQAQVMNAFAANPFWAERLLALSAGSVTNAEDWYCVKQLDSCAIDQNEYIKRMTFCQDPEPSSAAFRTRRLKLCGHLVTTVANVTLPAAIADLSAGYDLKWDPAFPHQNAFPSGGAGATIIYMGETATDPEMRRTRDLIDDFLRRSIRDDEKSLLARQRVAIWYRDDAGQVQLFEQRRLLNIDDPKTTSSLDVAKED